MTKSKECPTCARPFDRDTDAGEMAERNYLLQEAFRKARMDVAVAQHQLDVDRIHRAARESYLAAKVRRQRAEIVRLTERLIAANTPREAIKETP